MAKLFGTDGVRGKANVYPMTADFALKLAQAIGSVIATDKKKVAICRDTRISGEMIESALVAGFTSMGVDVELLGVLPTPTMAYIVPSLGVDMAVIISASHNPYYDNGIKLMKANGDKFDDETTSQLEYLVAKNEFELSPEKIGTVKFLPKADKLYVEMVSKIVPSLKGLRVVLDCANGAFHNIMPEIFKNLGAGVISVGVEPNGVNINKGCGSTSPDLMCATVADANAHLGIAVDGDGDRIVICDEEGKRVGSDQLMAFLAKYFLDSGKLKANALVATVVSNLALEKYIKSLGMEYYQTAVGERYVVDKMKEIGANVGGEESGHLVLADYAKGGDGLVVGLIVAHGLLKSGQKMSEVFPLFKLSAQKRVDVVFEDRKKFDNIMDDADLQGTIEQARKDMGEFGKILVRKSGTEPKLQIWVWGDDEGFVNQISARIVDKAKTLV